MNTLRILATVLLLSVPLHGARIGAADLLEVEIVLTEGTRPFTFSITDPFEIRTLLDAAKSLPAAAEAPSREPNRSGPRYQRITLRNRSTIDPELLLVQVRQSDVALRHATGDGTTDEARVDREAQLERRILALAQRRADLPEALRTSSEAR